MKFNHANHKMQFYSFRSTSYKKEIGNLFSSSPLAFYKSVGFCRLVIFKIIAPDKMQNKIILFLGGWGSKFKTTLICILLRFTKKKIK